MRQITVALADDHPIVRDGLKTILGLIDSIKVVGTAEDGEKAAELAAQQQPDVMLVDLYMPVMNGVEATKVIKHHSPNTHVVLITSQPDPDSVALALLNGASGYILKEWETEEIVRVIHSVVSGQLILPALASEKLTTSLASLHQTFQLDDEQTIAQQAEKLAWGQWDKLLSNREKQILLLLLDHKSNTEMAKLLHLSTGTIKNYLSSIYKTLAVENRAEAKKKLLDVLRF